MFTIDLPDAPAHHPVATIVADARDAQPRRARKERAIGVCHAVDFNSTGEARMDPLSPGMMADDYFVRYEGLRYDPWKKPSPNVELVVPPKHGTLEYSKESDGTVSPAYTPSVGYVGEERIVFRVKVEGATVRVVYLLKVTKRFADSPGVHDIVCKKTGTRWKIS